jgi:hypothetical protein
MRVSCLYLNPNLVLYLLKNHQTIRGFSISGRVSGKRIGPLVKRGGLITEQLESYTANRLRAPEVISGGATVGGQKPELTGR